MSFVTSPAVGPVITKIAVAVTDITATITWATDQLSTTQVLFGTTSNLVFTVASTLDPTLVTSHSVTLNGLQPDTTYYYQVQSQNADGTLSVYCPFRPILTMTGAAGVVCIAEVI